MLEEFHTVAAAWEAFTAIEAIPKGKRRWRGDKKQRVNHCTAFGRFAKGLAAQVKLRGVQPLEDERLTELRFKPRRGCSDLQLQAGWYLQLAPKS